jgi:alcohol dehydrogenase class IV
MTPLFGKVEANKCRVETLYVEDTNKVVKLFTTEGIRSLVAALPKIMQDTSVSPARSLALYGAWLCGKCLATTTVTLDHKLCHPQGGSFNLPHAESYAIMLLPHALSYTASDIAEVMNRRTPTRLCCCHMPSPTLHLILLES